MHDCDMDLDDYDYLQSLSEGAESSLLENPEHYGDEGRYKPPQEPTEAPRKVDDWGYEVELNESVTFIEDAELVEVEVLPNVYVSMRRLDLEDLLETETSLGYNSFWDAVDTHCIYFEPANSHWRRHQHLERYYVAGTEGVPNRYEQARGREVLRALRRASPDYYKAKSREQQETFRNKNRETCQQRTQATKAKETEEERKARRKRENRKAYLKRKEQQANVQR